MTFQSPFTQYSRNFSRRACNFKVKEKYVIILVFLTFGLLCLGAIFFLPDQAKIRYVKDHIHQAGNDIFIPQMKIGSDGNPILQGQLIRHEPGDQDNDVHAIEDKARLQEKIRKDWQQEKMLQRLEKRLNLSRSQHLKVREDINSDKLRQKQIQIMEMEKSAKNVVIEHDKGINVSGNSIENEQQRVIKEMMTHAWSNYVKYAWGENELRPSSRQGHRSGIFGASSLGASIIDSLSTLYIMGMKNEFMRARDWVATSFNFNKAGELSVFETNIRFLGGLLSAYALSGDKVFRVQAENIAQKMLPAFKTPTGIPMGMINVVTGKVRNYGWASGGSSILAEFGTLHLEFTYLSAITHNPVYANKVNKIRRFIQQNAQQDGLYPNYLNPNTGKWGTQHISIGALGDSFYEYLLKSWIQSGKTDKEAREMYDKAMRTLDRHCLVRSNGGFLYYADLKNYNKEHKMGHLACFAGGLLAYGANGSADSAKYVQQGAEITRTCHESYDRTATKLGPEVFRFDGNNEVTASRANEKYYILRPETIESYFYLWRITKKKIYRDWGWQAVEALNRHCRVDGGFVGLKDVYAHSPTKDDVQQSWFFAETLKYLYLLFSDDDVLPLSQWVLNTEAHPLPIKGSPVWFIPPISNETSKTS